MGNIILNSDQLNLPGFLIDKHRGKQFEIIETLEGILLKVLPDPITSAKGRFKTARFSSEIYFNDKVLEKDMEKK